jgi:flagellar hook-associated protein FlgK
MVDDHDKTMNSTTSIAISGMNAATVRLDVAAHNIANAQTPDFQRQEAVQQTVAGGGVATTVVTQPPPTPPKLPTGSLFLGDAVQQLEALYAFKASQKVVQTQQEMLGVNLDVKV